MNKLVGKWGPLVKIHYYNHGKKYGEAIGLLTAHLPSLKKFNKPCVCDFHTEALSGWSKDPRQTKVGTKDSSAYPLPLCRKWVAAVDLDVV